MPPYVEDEGRRYENSDRWSSERSRTHGFQAEEPRSYQGYWVPDEVVEDMEDYAERRERRRQRRGYRQDRYQDSELSGSEYRNPPPSAPTPPPHHYGAWGEQQQYESDIEDGGRYYEDVYDDLPSHQNNGGKSIYEQSFGRRARPGSSRRDPFYDSIQSLIDEGMDELEHMEEPARPVIGSEYQLDL
jgi:hypothetical protein